MAQIQLLGPSGIMPLVLFIADGKLLADNVPVKVSKMRLGLRAL